ncbi:MAG: bifunctional non-ous end joining protein LigD [Thermoleophilaceae bacterium]|nr:bifunctional non-ous end joining protein LigD [Thermoleophilaceae bacterium]
MSGARFVQPMKAVLSDRPFSDPAWIFERKLDGIRCVAVRSGGDVRLWSRNELSLNGRYPEVADALARDGADDLVLDGEVVAFEGSNTSFARLARRGHERVAIYLYLFDVMHLGGRDTRQLPLRERKRLLRRAVSFGGALRLNPYRNRDGEAMYEKACRSGWEGVIAKRADSVYTSARSRDWLKLKCSAEQELVVGGYTAPKGSREELGALLVGYFEDGELRYAGRVGTGFDRATLRDLARRLRPLRRADSPFSGAELRGRDTTWVEPELVVQVGFSEWTRDGRLRHPRFLGVREDKDARDVVRERAS